MPQKMSETLARIVDLVRVGEVRISAHGYDEIAEDGMLAGEVVDGIEAAVVIEDYPDLSQRPLCSCLSAGWRRKADSRSVGHPAGADITGGAGGRLSAGSGAVDR